jgi:hypothetical protein
LVLLLELRKPGLGMARASMGKRREPGQPGRSGSARKGDGHQPSASSASLDHRRTPIGRSPKRTPRTVAPAAAAAAAALDPSEGAPPERRREGAVREACAESLLAAAAARDRTEQSSRHGNPADIGGMPAAGMTPGSAWLARATPRRRRVGQVVATPSGFGAAEESSDIETTGRAGAAAPPFESITSGEPAGKPGRTAGPSD